MGKQHRAAWHRSWLVVPLAGALALGACGDDDDGGAADTEAPAGTEAPATEAPAETEAPAGTEAPGTTTGGGTGAADLAAAGCPNPVVVQTDWNVEAEHGAMYQMVGEGYEVDTDLKAVRGPLVTSGGQETGVDIEIRIGGPAIGFQLPNSQMYQDTDILLGFVSVDDAMANSAEQPTIAVVTPLDKNPQIMMWDPAQFTGETIADVAPEVETILYFEGATYIDYLIAEGIVPEDKLDSSYDGTPTRWVASGGRVLQQGFASAEPFIYENEVPEWGQPVAFQLIHDTGWEAYSQALSVRAEAFEENRDCLAALVPVIQQATVDYVNDPGPVNALILELNEQYDTGWVYSQGVADFSVEQQLELGLVGNGPNETIGDFDDARMEDFFSKAAEVLAARGIEMAEGLTPADIYTNEFIDPSIGL